jgi:hypothetical protein
VPAEAASAKAKIRLSFADWKEGKVAETTLWVPIVEVSAGKKK